ncbi:MAG: ABC transporter substrate-binding protein [Chloroflexi bacterium CFX4]|nr:ABC transporter substrate-binding protein [Chloroflexi bacterium CFX4]MDL1924566.1 ABC transporter substrate-binding protein [Chloroflexi bacterium CFX3]
MKRLLLSVFVAALAALMVQPPVHAQTEKVRLGYLPVITYATFFIGIERGYFAEEGIEIDLLPLPSGGGDSIVQLAAGNLDIAATGAGAALWNAIALGFPVKIVAPLHTERPPLATPLVIAAKRADQIKSVADLKGGKIAINGVGSAVEYWVYAALKREGISMDEVTTVAMPFPQMAAALDAGAVDAAVITEPLATLGRDQGLLTVLADDFIDGITVTYVFMSESMLTERRAVAEAFMRAYLRAARDLQGEIDESTASIIEKYTNVPAPVVLRMNRQYYDPNGVIPVADLEEVQRYFKGRGLLEYADLLEVPALIDGTLVESALAAIGEYVPAPAATPDN